MKIIFIAPRYHTNQHFIIKTLLEHGNDVKFFSLYRAKTEEYSAIAPETVTYSSLFKIAASWVGDRPNQMTKFKLQYAFPNPFSLYRKIRSFNPDVIIVRELINFSLLSIVIAWFLSIKLILYTQEPLCGPKGKGLRRKIMKFIETLKMSPIVEITPVIGNCSQHSPRTHSYYLPFVIGFDFFLEDKRYFKEDKINILMVGKYIRRKNHLLLLEAIAQLQNKYPLVLTIVVGEEDTGDYGSYPSEIKNFIQKKNLNSIVKIKKNLSFKEMQSEYLGHDLFVLPSAHEPFSISVLEAMGYGLPVICSDSCGTKYSINEGENGFVFKTNNLDDLIHSITGIIKDRRTHLRMGNASFKIIKDQYSPEKYYSKFKEVLQDL